MRNISIDRRGNTEGWRCEQCKTGYFGNPAKGCELCRCQGIGSQNNECDRETGQCKCKKNYDGYQCDECAVSKMPNYSLLIHIINIRGN